MMAGQKIVASDASFERLAIHREFAATAGGIAEVRKYTADELEEARKNGYGEGKKAGTAEAEAGLVARALQELQAINSRSHEVIAVLQTERNLIHAQAVEISLAAARGVVRAALEKWQHEQVLAVLRSAADHLRDKPRVIITVADELVEKVREFVAAQRDGEPSDDSRGDGIEIVAASQEANGGGARGGGSNDSGEAAAPSDGIAADKPTSNAPAPESAAAETTPATATPETAATAPAETVSAETAPTAETAPEAAEAATSTPATAEASQPKAASVTDMARGNVSIKWSDGALEFDVAGKIATIESMVRDRLLATDEAQSPALLDSNG